MESFTALASWDSAADDAQAVRWCREPLGIKSLLALAPGYRILHRILGTDGMRRHYVNNFVKPELSCRVIDLGCGTADILNYLPAVNYVGVDYNAHYIRSNRRRFPKARFHIACVSTHLKKLLAPADLVFVNALLHHLNDAEVDTLFASAKQLISNGGRVCTLDNHNFPGQNPISRFLIANDRGRYVRSREGYEKIGARHFRDIRYETSSRLLNFPYDIVMFEFRDPIL